MQSLVTRFHLLLSAVTFAATGVALLHVPADFYYSAHWSGSTADWLWPRDTALAVGPILALALLLIFFNMGRLFSKNQFAKSQHILDPALTVLLGLVAATQFGLLLTGVGSDLNVIRIIGFGFGLLLLVLGVVLFEAERHTYAGIRLPWPIKADASWTLVHRATGGTTFLAGAGLLALAWLDADMGPLIIGFAAAVAIPTAMAALATLISRQ